MKFTKLLYNGYELITSKDFVFERVIIFSVSNASSSTVPNVSPTTTTSSTVATNTTTTTTTTIATTTTTSSTTAKTPINTTNIPGTPIITAPTTIASFII
ncbi:unnamed protein product, partial [Adineta steineri]